MYAAALHPRSPFSAIRSRLARRRATWHGGLQTRNPQIWREPALQAESLGVAGTITAACPKASEHTASSPDMIPACINEILSSLHASSQRGQFGPIAKWNTQVACRRIILRHWPCARRSGLTASENSPLIRHRYFMCAPKPDIQSSPVEGEK